MEDHGEKQSKNFYVSKCKIRYVRVQQRKLISILNFKRENFDTSNHHANNHSYESEDNNSCP